MANKYPDYMARCTINMPKELSELITSDAKEGGMSISRFLAKLVETHYSNDDRYPAVADAIANNPHYGWYSKTESRSAAQK